MTGLIYAVAPLAAACLVARREPAHRPVALALGASALYSVAALPAMSSYLDGRALLGLFALVAAASGRAYVRAFGWRWTLERFTFGVGIAGLCTVLATTGVSRWQIMTWGPFVASSVVGGLAVWGWWSARPWGYLGWDAPQSHVEAWARAREKYPLGITQRVALILLASDVCMLLFVPWPGVQAWQGRAAAMAVSVVQIVWLIKERKRHGN
jgi:hypothetical protein